MVAPRATTKRNKNSSPSTSSGLIFYTAHSTAVCTVASGRVRVASGEVAVTNASATKRTAPVVTVGAHTEEHAIAVTADTGNGKLQG